ncbi:MAG TPA: hypothetical protein DD435_16475 [Cyanobacteria bacterium UBA8530]|nr:hypothetical protein [Cyanobacteria bacterium UBA8530]
MGFADLLNNATISAEMDDISLFSGYRINRLFGTNLSERDKYWFLFERCFSPREINGSLFSLRGC